MLLLQLMENYRMPIMLGNFIEADDKNEYICMIFFGKDHSLQERWRNNGISADFLAEYWTPFFPAYLLKSNTRLNEIKGTIAYVANELLENTMKFRDDIDTYPVFLKASLSKQSLRFYATNSLSPLSSQRYQEYIQRLLVQNPIELYLWQLEQNALDKDNSVSRLGLLTLLNDYHVELAWKFEKLNAPTNVMTVTIMASIPLSSESIEKNCIL